MELAELQKKERDILDAPDKDLSISIESCFNSDQKLEETKLPSVSKSSKLHDSTPSRAVTKSQ